MAVQLTTPDGQTHTSDQATIWRWREHFQHDFATRMDWCVADAFEMANHNPKPVLNGVAGLGVVQLTARPGAKVELSAAGTADPDGDALNLTWLIYAEAGTVAIPASLDASEGEGTALNVPAEAKAGQTIHVILQAQDRGTPGLFAYRRAVVTIAD